MFRAALLGFALIAVGAVSSAAQSLPTILANTNQVPVGKLRAGVLTVHLVARTGVWYPEENEGPGHVVHAFAPEEGVPQIPGPLIRVREGTEIRITIRNSIPHETLVVHGLHTRPGAANDTVQVASGAVREVRFQAGVPGTYFYWATSTRAPTLVERYGEDSQLTGALIVDPRASRAPPNDRIFVVGMWSDPAEARGKGPLPVVTRRAAVVNGRSWPHTERFTFRQGDSVRWRWINATDRPHPMHLHGFFFRVDSRGSLQRDSVYGETQRRLAVTETMLSGNTFTLTWVPDRPGNWMMHCHTVGHIAAALRLGRATKSAPAEGRHALDHSLQLNHTLQMMSGLAVGAEVLPAAEAATRALTAAEPRRKLRLLVKADPGRYGSDPGMGFMFAEGGAEPPADSLTIPGPPLVLTRGEPVSITVVNRLPEATSVHWHGIELESYYDGMSGWSGSPGHIQPAIAPGDSFVVEFTPPRAGTFIYHTHFEEARQLSSGLYGPLIVLEPGERYDPRTDRVLLVSLGGPGEATPMLLNGRPAPELDLEVGTKYRLRLININPNGVVTVSLFADTSLVTWRAIAKDGADLPPAQATFRPASQLIGVGETYDFELVPSAPGVLRLEVRNRLGLQLTGVVRVRRAASTRPAM